MIRKLFFFILLTAGYTAQTTAQTDLQFSQYMFNYLYINPAYAGYKEQINATTFFRAQYLGFKGAPTTASVSVDAPVFSDHMGVGIQINTDKIGIQNTLTAGIAYSYRIQVGAGGRLCFGIQAGISQFSSDPSQSIPSDSNDPIVNQGAYNSLDLTSKAGLFYYNPLFYLGVSASNLLTSSLHATGIGIGTPQQEKHYYLSAGAMLQLNDELALKPSFLLKDPQTGISTADINCFLLMNSKIWLGASYRMGVPFFSRGGGVQASSSSNAALIMTEIYLTERLRIGYAYDYPLSRSMDFKSGSHEISIGYYLPVQRNVSKGSMVTPRYF